MTQKRLVSSNPAEAKMTRCTCASRGCASVGIAANPMSSTSTRDIVGFIHVVCFIAPSCTFNRSLDHHPSCQEDVAPCGAPLCMVTLPYPLHGPPSMCAPAHHNVLRSAQVGFVRLISTDASMTTSI